MCALKTMHMNLGCLPIARRDQGQSTASSAKSRKAGQEITALKGYSAHRQGNEQLPQALGRQGDLRGIAPDVQ